VKQQKLKDGQGKRKVGKKEGEGLEKAEGKDGE
jgi:hypothetical protein